MCIGARHSATFSALMPIFLSLVSCGQQSDSPSASAGVAPVGAPLRTSASESATTTLIATAEQSALPSAGVPEQSSPAQALGAGGVPAKPAPIDSGSVEKLGATPEGGAPIPTSNGEIEDSRAAAGVPASPARSGPAGAAWQKIPKNVDPAILKADVPLEGLDTRGGRYAAVPFSLLAGFKYDQYEVEESIAKSPDGKPAADHIPANIRGLNDQTVAIRGFMVPIEVRRNDVKSFLLVRNRLGCCFGMQIGINEWIYARMPDDKTAKYVNDVPITAYGRLEVGEDVREGMVVSVYRLRVDDVVHLGGY